MAQAPLQTFKPHHYKWIIIKNKHYEFLQTFSGYENFANIDQVDNDARNVKNGIIGLGARQLDIQVIEDADFKTFSSLMTDLRQTINDNWARGQQRTLIFIYYAGHGVMTNMGFALCNGARLSNGQKGKPSKTRYPLEM